MIIYWAWPCDGAGHAVMAAAICRHLKGDVTVVRGTPRESAGDVNRALDHFGIPYQAFHSKRAAVEWIAREHPDSFVVFDDHPGSATAVEAIAGLYVWRMGRRARPVKPTPTVKVEGDDAFWPILLLDDDEILSREEARAELGVDQQAWLTVGVPSTSRYGVVEAEKVDILLTPDRWWPALRWLRAADVLVGCVGANFFAEARYLGTTTRLIKAPNAPDQSVRIREVAEWPVLHGAAKKLASLIDRMHGGESHPSGMIQPH